MNALTGLGIGNSLLVFLSYVWIRIKPIRPETSFEDWVSNRFGRRLYRIFFKTYTEKVWGIPCNRIGAQWAAQRIKGLSLFTAITSMLLKGFRKPGAKQIKTLIEEFEYPRLGPGMMWEAFRADVERMGGTVVLQRQYSASSTTAPPSSRSTYGKDERRRVEVGAFISTMPLRELVQKPNPPAPESVRAAAARLNYRDFLTVALIIDTPTLFPDNWIYVHDSRVKMGRIQNFKNWSPNLRSERCLGLEYFCFEGDGLWTMADADLVALGAREMPSGCSAARQSSTGRSSGCRRPIRSYDDGFMDALAVLREYLAGFSNLQVAGRNGMHRYNNQDHSMVTAFLAVENLLGDHHDVWAVNADDDYHEESEIY